MNRIIGLCMFTGGIPFAIVFLMITSAQFNGIWKTEAYGLCLNARLGVVQVYAVTEKSYTRMDNYDGVIINGTFYSGMGKFELDRSGKVLKLVDNGTGYVYSADRQPKGYFYDLHEVIKGDQAGKFRMFYEELKENYAFADMYGADFDEEYSRYAPLVDSQTADETLYGYMCSMVEKLDDGHVEISWNDKTYTPSDYKPVWFKDHAQALVNVIKEKYVRINRFDDCDIRYGTLRDDIGYFTGQEYPAYSKQAYYNGNFTSLQEAYVKPGNSYYGGNVIIITSGYTVSAGESLIRDMLANPGNKITVIGETTAGYYSDAIPMMLPDGFDYSLSAERYCWYDGTMLEGKGIVPDVEISFDPEAVRQGRDNALDWILSKDFT